jgi:hypothetical protein
VLKQRSVARAAVAVVIAACGALLLVRALSTIDLQATLRTVLGIGLLAPVALLPFLGAMLADAVGMRWLLAALGRNVPLRGLLPIRFATEALHVTAPAGFLVADSATATLLHLHFGVPLGEGALLAVARKWLVMRAHAIYIGLGATCGATALAAVSERHLGGPWLPWAVGASAVLPLVLSVAMGLGFRGGAVLARVQAALGRLPWAAAREWTNGWQPRAALADARLEAIGRAHYATWAAAGAFFGCWLFESLDTAVIVRLVGGPRDFVFAMAAEVGISMLRSVGNVAPAGLGVQDAGYATLFPAMGMNPEITAAFVLVKRAKEVVWIALGYALLAILRRPDAPRASDRLRSLRDHALRLLPRNA